MELITSMTNTTVGIRFPSLNRMRQDVTNPFVVDFGNGHGVTAIAEPVTGDIDYAAKLEVVVP